MLEKKMRTKRKNLLRDSSGVSLIAAVFLILVLSFLGWVMLSMSNLASRESVNELYSARAWYDACSAADVRIVQLDRGKTDVKLFYQFEQGSVMVDVQQEVTAYWKLTVTATNGSDGSADYARRRLLVKFLKKL